MKKLSALLLIFVLFITLCACGEEKEADPNEGKLLLTEELTAEMEAGFDTDVGGLSVSLASDNIRAIIDRANDDARIMGANVKFTDFELSYYEKADDYNYTATGTLHSSSMDIKTTAELWFAEANTESGHIVTVSIDGLRQDIKKNLG